MAGMYTPRSIFVDTDDSLLDKIQSGPMHDLYQPGQFIGGKGLWQEVSGTSVSSVKAETIEVVMEGIRRELEMCDGFQGFFFNYAMSGGTSTSLLMKLEECIDSKDLKINFSVFPN